MYVPDELENYNYDSRAESSAKRLTKIMGILTLLFLVGTIVLFVIKQEVLGTVCFIIFFLTAVIWCTLWKSKKKALCSSCRNKMEQLDTVFSVEGLGKLDRKWLNKPLFSGDGRSLFEGADGCVYEVSSSTMSGHWNLSKYSLRWYVCHQCKNYFRYGNIITLLEQQKNNQEIKDLKEKLEQR